MTTLWGFDSNRLPCRFHIAPEGERVPLPLTRPPASVSLRDLVGSRDCLEVTLLSRRLTPLDVAALKDAAVMLENEIFLRAAVELPDAPTS